MPRIRPQSFVHVVEFLWRPSCRWVGSTLALTLCATLLSGAAAADKRADKKGTERAAQATADKATIKRGEYLVAIAGCTDCHTPGHFLGNPDLTRRFGGSDVGFAIPTVGVFVGPNLTPDNETGLGKWTNQQIVTAIITGKRPDGRQLVPAMPYPSFARLTPADAQAIAVYLKSLPPVQNKVPGPFGPTDKPTSLVMVVLPGEAYSAMPQPRPK